MSRRRRLSTLQVWRVPILLAVLSALGLAAALVGDGPWDLLSWLALAAPVAACAWPLLRRTGQAPP